MPERAILKSRNKLLKKSFVQLESVLRQIQFPSSVSSLLHPCRSQLVDLCSNNIKLVERNLLLLDLEMPDLLPDILSNTEQAMRVQRLINTHFIAPLLRITSHDALVLQIIAWMHQGHNATTKLPAVFASGPPSVRPFVHLIPLYYFPHIEQNSLLGLPLLFHEFGHVLYQLSLPEMQDLTRELQDKIEQRLRLRLNRAQVILQPKLAEHRQHVIDVWGRWIEEFFCDAVGLIIGGPAFLLAVTQYIEGMSRDDFSRSVEGLKASTHPINWRRIRLLTARARAFGWEKEAEAIEETWKIIARILQVTDENNGFDGPELDKDITRAIDDMLTVVDLDPMDRQHTYHESHTLLDNPISLLNCAWQRYQIDEDQYALWETVQVSTFLGIESEPPYGFC
jgi:hypothetical protein